MIQPKDIERLVIAHQAAEMELTNGNPRAAAKIVCEELNWLVKDNNSFWAGLRDLEKPIEEHLSGVAQVFNHLTEFIDMEISIFDRLGLKPDQSEKVVGAVFAELGMIQRLDLEDLTGQGFGNLHDLVGKAAELVCKQSKNAYQRGVDWVVSKKGRRILAGAAVAGANGVTLLSTAVHIPVAIPFLVGHEAICTASVTLGIATMKGDASGLLDLLKAKG